MTVLPKERRPTSDIIYEQPTLCKNMEGIAREYLLVPVEKSTFDHCFLKLFWNRWLGCWCFTGECVTAVSSVAQSCPTLCDPHESQHARPPCPSPTPGVYSNPRPSSQWCHPTFSSPVVPFSSCPQSLPASGSFPMSQLFTWGGQSTGVSASASDSEWSTNWLGSGDLEGRGIRRVGDRAGWGQS